MGETMVKNNKTFQNFQQKDGQRVGIFGASGSGKTTKARGILKACRRLIIFDSVKNEWVINAQKWLGKKPLVISTTGDFLRALKKVFCRPDFLIVFRPNYGQEMDDLNEICGILFRAQTNYGITHNASLTLFVEEAQEAIPSGLARINPKHYALLLARMGRAKGINLVIASQRIKTVDITFRANLNVYYIFRLAELSDINEANQFIKNKDALMKLPNGAYFFIGDAGQIKKNKIF